MPFSLVASPHRAKWSASSSFVLGDPCGTTHSLIGGRGHRWIGRGGCADAQRTPSFSLDTGGRAEVAHASSKVRSRHFAGAGRRPVESASLLVLCQFFMPHEHTVVIPAPEVSHAFDVSVVLAWKKRCKDIRFCLLQLLCM